MRTSFDVGTESPPELSCPSPLFQQLASSLWPGTLASIIRLSMTPIRIPHTRHHHHATRPVTARSSVDRGQRS